MMLRSWFGSGVRRARWKNVVAFALGAVALSATYAEEAQACGGCLVQQTEDTQVTSHRMILSISPDATTLWDQISYAGAPESFAWVLPVVGLADVELSSDALFASLEQMTAVQVSSPPLNCNPGGCANGAGFDSAPVPQSPEEGGVTVVAQETVGPYETVQLRSTTPNALRDWLLTNGYNIPADIAPVIDAYVAEGFDFLALKLVPGEGVSSMRPVRVTVPGANPELPLRMVAAGTGAVTPITLWILGEGRYEPMNFSSFLIASEQLVWDWDSQSSNYAQLRSEGFAAASGKAWLVEAAEPLSTYALRDALMSLAQYQPLQSGYGDENGDGAVEEAEADVAALFSTIPESSVWVSRIYGELSRTALATDLEIGASMDQTTVARFLQATRTKGTEPPCPVTPGCGDDPDINGGDPSNDGSAPSGMPGSCATDGRTEGPLTLAGAAALAALALARRTRRSAEGPRRRAR